MAYTSENIPLFMKGWTLENKNKLLTKMKNLGISQGGFLNTGLENIALYDYLVKEVNTPENRIMYELIKARELVSSLCEYLDDECKDEKSRMLSDDCTAFLNSSFEVAKG